MSFIMPPSAVTSTSSIIIILTLVHPFATSWPSSPKGDARTLRDWLSVSYVTQYPVPPIFSFPLEGKSREAGKGVRGRVPIGCSIAVLTANRRPVSFGLLTLRHACGMRVQRVQKVQRVQRVVVAADAADYKKAGPRPPSFRPKRNGVEKSPPLMVRAALGREISRLRVSSERLPSAPYRHAAPLEMTVAAHAPVISTVAERSGEISPSDGMGSIGAGDLQAQSIIKAFSICPIPARSPARDDERAVSPYRHVKKKGAAGAGVFGRQDAEKKKPLISRSFFFISEEIRIHSSGIRMLRHRSRYRCLWSLRRSCIRRGVLRS